MSPTDQDWTANQRESQLAHLKKATDPIPWWTKV